MSSGGTYVELQLGLGCPASAVDELQKLLQPVRVDELLPSHVGALVAAWLELQQTSRASC